MNYDTCKIGHHILSLFLGAHFIISSTLKINSAASLAACKACCLTLRHSVIPSSSIFPTIPLTISKPAVEFSLATSTFNSWINSAESYPPLSEMIVGNYLKALA